MSTDHRTSTRRRDAVRGVLAPGVLAALAVVYVVWGSTYVALRVAVRALPPLTLSGVRFLVAGSLLYAWCAWRRHRRPGRWRRPTLREWRACAVLGLALPAAGTGGATWAEQRLPSGTTALLLAGIPLWITVAGLIVDREPVRPRTAVGWSSASSASACWTTRSPAVPPIRCRPRWRSAVRPAGDAVRSTRATPPSPHNRWWAAGWR